MLCDAAVYNLTCRLLALFHGHHFAGSTSQYFPAPAADNQAVTPLPQGVNYHSMVFAGETHNELAWRKRLHLPLQFLYGAERCSDEQAG
jgi:hypothetical protein